MTAMRRTDDHHHSPEDVERYARTACDIADKIGLDAEDRAALLPQLVQLVSSKQVFYEPMGGLPNLAIPGNSHR